MIRTVGNSYNFIIMISRHRHTARGRRQSCGSIVTRRNERSAVRVNERRISAVHDFSIFKIRVLGKLGGSGDRIVITHQTADVSDVLEVTRMGIACTMKLVLCISRVVLGDERVEVVALFP